MSEEDPQKALNDYACVASQTSFWKCLSKCRREAMGQLEAERGRTASAAVEYEAVTEEHVRFSDAVTKTNRKGKRQKRVLVITNVALYNFDLKKFKKYKRRIRLSKLTKVFVPAGTTDEFIIHARNEYDYRLENNKREEIIAVMEEQFRLLTGSEMNVVKMEERHIEALMVYKDEIRRRIQTSSQKPPSMRRLDSAQYQRFKSGRNMHSARGLALKKIHVAKSKSGLISKSSAGAADKKLMAKATRDRSTNALTLKEIRGILMEIKEKSENSTLQEICSWAGKNDEDIVKIITEIVYVQDAAKDLLWWLVTVPQWANSFYSHLVSTLSHDSEFVRHWAIKTLWQLIPMYAAQGLFQDSPPNFEFRTSCLRALKKHVLDLGMYISLMEVVLDNIRVPSAGYQETVETFGKAMVNEEPFYLILELLSTNPSQCEIKNVVLKDINMLLLRKNGNEEVLLNMEHWQDYFFPLFEKIPQDSVMRDELEEDLFKYTVNIFATLHLHYFNSGKVKEGIDGTMQALRTFSGWYPDSINVARFFFMSLLSKIFSTANQWKHDFERQEWQSLWSLASIIEDFMFYQPAQMNDDDVFPEKMMLAERRNQAHQWTRKSDNKSACLGIHLHPVTATCDDLILADRVGKLFQKLGLKPGDTSCNELVTNKHERETLKKGVSLAGAFRDYKTMYEGIDNQVESERQHLIMEKVSKFLERRKRKGVAMGFFSRQNKRKLVKSLQVSMVRQQAERVMRNHTVAKTHVCGKHELEEVTEEIKPLPTIHAKAVTSQDQESSSATTTPKDLDELNRLGLEPESAQTCSFCQNPILNGESIFALKKYWHPEHLSCSVCCTPVSKLGGQFFETEDKVLCRKDYIKEFRESICAGCLQPLKKGELFMNAIGLRWHQDHFSCASCQKTIPFEESFYTHDDEAYCHSCDETLFRTCVACNKVVAEEEGGYQALDKIWHKEHFACTHCKKPLYDSTFFGKDVGDGCGERPYCEEHFVQLFLPKCHTCKKPIQEDAIEACGHSFHEDCFVCTTCGCGFADGAFYEHDGNPYCETHYYDQFGEKCHSCNEVIRGDVMNACGSSWHVEHFVCTYCQEPFEDFQFFEEGGRPYCDQHYLELFGEKCAGCGEYMTESGITALGKSWHPEHLVCKLCNKQVGSGDVPVFKGDDGCAYCEEHWTEHFAQRCAKCDETISGDPLLALDKKWHPDCFSCTMCSKPLGEGVQVYSKDKLPYCREDFLSLFCEKCPTCGEAIAPEEAATCPSVKGKKYHPGHLVCTICAEPFGVGENIFINEEQPYCKEHYIEKFCERCGGCNKPITGQCLNALGAKWHKECLVCFCCNAKFDGQLFVRGGLPACKTHSQMPVSRLPPEAVSKLQQKAAALARKQLEEILQKQSEAPAAEPSQKATPLVAKSESSTPATADESQIVAPVNANKSQPPPPVPAGNSQSPIPATADISPPPVPAVAKKSQPPAPVAAKKPQPPAPATAKKPQPPAPATTAPPSVTTHKPKLSADSPPRPISPPVK